MATKFHGKLFYTCRSRFERLACLDSITAVLFSFNFSCANKQSGKTAKVEKCLRKNTLSEVGKMARGEKWGEVLQTN